MFTKGPAVASRALFFSVVAVGLILVSLYTDWLAPVRAQLGAVATPFYWVTNLPQRIGDWGDTTFASRQALREENEALKSELLILQRKLQQMAALAAENVRLRRLLGSSDMLQDNVLVAELVGVSPNPLSHSVVINKGAQDGVYSGQPVLDAFGLMGQVVEANPNSSRVLLITDTSHALPVQVNRNGVRAIAEGTGHINRLRLRHVSNTTDIRVGDLLVSSGLGDRFPVGYPVAEVEQVVRDPGQSFSTVIARPMARLDRSRHLLLVFAGGASERGAAEQLAPEVPIEGAGGEADD
ncbi:rod shape-determining protein MreC [Marinimicrobium sp. C6131]|uniref:rod shape-determining protein MreC n=1 Tax=Marinimicrobium sp. C6131 TaxID=3022676 RepID=UPI00223E1F51|nr:rod shape-determining protein MreC [Marinimicrobium sp. C6131]UZJ46227.1 rod shape-determining protein MreC [Marinimicrobium sp. C6131]